MWFMPEGIVVGSKIERAIRQETGEKWIQGGDEAKGMDLLSNFMVRRINPVTVSSDFVTFISLVLPEVSFFAAEYFLESLGVNNLILEAPPFFDFYHQISQHRTGKQEHGKTQDRW